MLIAGQKVLMADGSTKLIETIAPGDQVLDWKGNIEIVEGVMCNKIDTTAKKYYRYNDKLTLTDTHPMFSTDGDFYSMGNPKQFWAVYQNYVGPYYQIMGDYNWGTNIEKIKSMEVGTIIAAYSNSSEIITSIQEVTPADGWVYSHKVSGSGTYVVEGLCVNAWPNARFDYSTWTRLKDSDVVSVIRRKDTGLVEILVNADFSNLGYDYDIWSNLNRNFVDPSNTTPPGGLISNGGLNIVA